MKVNALDELIKNIVLGVASIGTVSTIGLYLLYCPKICELGLRYLEEKEEERKSSKMERIYSE